MEKNHYTRLKDRALLKIEGKDSAEFLQNILTIHIKTLSENFLFPAALLTPQGKIFADFQIFFQKNSYFIDIYQPLLVSFLQKISLYRLHAQVTFNVLENYTIFAGENLDLAFAEDGFLLTDTRFPPPLKIFKYYSFNQKEIDPFSKSPLLYQENPFFWEELLFNHGFLICQKDYPSNSLYPFDLHYDKIGAIDFDKGCYIGQEVISRIHHKNAIQKRLFLIQTEDLKQHFSVRDNVTENDKIIGKIFSINKDSGLALLKISFLRHALKNKENLSVNSSNIRIKDCYGRSFLKEISID